MDSITSDIIKIILNEAQFAERLYHFYITMNKKISVSVGIGNTFAAVIAYNIDEDNQQKMEMPLSLINQIIGTNARDNILVARIQYAIKALLDQYDDFSLIKGVE
jgi:NADH/NAD ratio-sensing transcriptional regulator Rex